MCYTLSMRIPKGTASAEIERKKSRFIAIASPLENPDAVKEIIQKTRRDHPQANHVVHAFISGKHGDIFGMSDDHEPKNTAGRPVLEILKGSGITNILLLVIRYFGGTKLGTGGLVKAYGDAAKAVLDQLKTEELIEKCRFSLTIPYSMYDQLKLVLEQHHAEQTEEDFTTDVHIEGMLPADCFNEVFQAVTDISSGNIVLERIDQADS